MTLSFSEKWSKKMGELAGKPTFFLSKIWEDLECDYPEEYIEYVDAYMSKFGGQGWDVGSPFPKTHTIREDGNNRWKAGNDIHFVINSRTKDRFQFAPVIKCVSVQTIEIIGAQTIYNCATGKEKHLIKEVIVDGKYLSLHEIQLLAYSDGFPTVRDFFNFFKVDTGNPFNHKFVGKIIHWTDKKY